MSEIHVSDLHKYYGENHVLDGVSFDVFRGEKVGLLGKNGSGKTTLFKILSGAESYESGFVSIAGRGRAGILDQIPEYPDGFTVLDVVRTAFERVWEIAARMREIERRMAEGDDSTALVAEYGAIQTEFEAAGGYTIESSIAKVCNGLGIGPEMQDRDFVVLSGGEKTRVNLARIILTDADILLLDEPTNHLDMSAVEWLEEFLSKYDGTVLVISHDRYFIDNVVSRVIEIIDGRIELYEGAYSYYAIEKEARRLQRLALYEQEQKKIRKLEEAIKRMRIWAGNSKNPKLFRRAKAMEKRKERMGRSVTARPKTDKQLKSAFQSSDFSGNEAVILKSVSKSYDGKCLFSDINLTIYRYEMAALIGDNGTGKTTLLKLITGQENPDSGVARVGQGMKFGFLPQIITFENPGTGMLEYFRNEFTLSEESARNRLAAFHFTGDDVHKRLSVLSGGEKSRLKLCVLMNRAINLLILDEPTNHLDIMSREWIEEAIEDFDGTVLFVSHDRYFINRFADRILEMKNGSLRDFRGSFDEYKAALEREKIHAAFIKSAFKKPAEKNARMSPVNTRSARLKELERQIGEYENRLERIKAEETLNASDYLRLNELYEENQKITALLGAVYKGWMELISSV